MKKQSHLILLFIFLQSAPVLSFAGSKDSIPDTNNVTTIDRSHSLFNNIITNPAYTGIYGGHNILVNAGIDNPLFNYDNLYSQQQYDIEYDVAFGKKRNNAVGASYTYLNEVTFVNSVYNLTYARNFNLTKNVKFYHKLRVGVSLSLNMSKGDWSKMTWWDQIDPAYGYIWGNSSFLFSHTDTSNMYIKSDIGAWYHNPVFYFGIATKNLTQPTTSYYRKSIIPREYNISTGGKIDIGNNFALHPSLNMTIVLGYEGKFSTYSPTVLGSYKNNYFFGFSYKDLNKITFHAGAAAFKCITFSGVYGISTNTDLNGMGYPAFVGGEIRINLKN